MGLDRDKDNITGGDDRMDVVVKSIFLLVHQYLNLELVALAMMLVGSTVPDMIRHSAIACAMAPTN